ncbi:MAG: radical SAM protein [Kiritimatiellia bacterium]
MSDIPPVSGVGCIFGPVPSRRLGRSLGIDLVPAKTCSYDCSYCQIGRTTAHTVERRRWCDPQDILRQLPERLGSVPDYITLSGAGEPTLYDGLGELIAGIKSLTDIPVAVITNGSLLWRADVRAELMGADLVAPSLDAGDAATFTAINRPVAELDFARMVRGLIEFRRQYDGKYWLEIFLIRGVNDSDAAVRALVKLAARIAPDRIQLNTVLRPPADTGLQPVPLNRLRELASRFSPPGEIIAEFSAAGGVGGSAQPADVLEMIRRHPCACEDISSGLGIAAGRAQELLQLLQQQGLIRSILQGGRTYYMAIENQITPP